MDKKTEKIRRKHLQNTLKLNQKKLFLWNWYRKRQHPRSCHVLIKTVHANVRQLLETKPPRERILQIPIYGAKKDQKLVGNQALQSGGPDQLLGQAARVDSVEGHKVIRSKS